MYEEDKIHIEADQQGYGDRFCNSWVLGIENDFRKVVETQQTESWIWIQSINK